MNRINNLLNYVWIIIIICISTIKVSAQIKYQIHGNVHNKIEALEFSTVLLFNKDTTTLLQETVSDSLGNFSFKNLEKETYFLKCKQLGYENFYTTIILKEPKSIYNMDTIFLNKKSNQLNTIAVKAQRKAIQKTSTGLIINAASNITQAGGTALDILKSTPTVTIDADDGITLRGKTPLILINGKVATIANPALIPASSVESIEIINNASAKYNANAESGIINIILKKNKLSGTNGSVVLGVGLGSRARVSSSLNINHKIKNWNIGFSYDNRFAGRTKNILGERTNYLVPIIHKLNQTRNDERLEQLQNFKLNIDFTPSKRHILSLEVLAGFEGQNNHEDLTTIINNNLISFYAKNNRFSNEFERAKNPSLSLDYAKSFNDARKYFKASITSSWELNKENTDIETKSLTETNLETGTRLMEKTHNYENGNITNLNIDYAQPLSNTLVLECGTQAIFRNIIADYANYKLVNGNYISNTAATTIFNFKENVIAAYILLNGYMGKTIESKWKYNVGLRTEQVNNKGISKNNNTSITNNYLKFFPSLSINYNYNKTSELKFYYSKRINRPSLGLLNPFTDITDSLNPHSGNPYLQPEIINAFALDYNTTWGKLSTTTSLFYRSATNTIRQFYTLQSNGTNLMLPINIGSTNTYGMEEIVVWNAHKNYDATLSASLFEQQLLGKYLDNSITNNALGWNTKLINNFTLHKTIKTQVIANYLSALATPQGKRIGQFSTDIGLQYKLGKGNAKLGITIVDIFNTLKSGYNNQANDFINYRNSKADTRAFMITYAYSFRNIFKDALLENQFSKEF